VQNEVAPTEIKEQGSF